MLSDTIGTLRDTNIEAIISSLGAKIMSLFISCLCLVAGGSHMCYAAEQENFAKISSLYQIIEGYSDGSMRENQNVTRAEMLKMAYRAANLTPSLEINCFDDTKNHWAETYICDAQARGIVIGEGTNFYPDRPVKHDEALKILLQTFGKNFPIKTGPSWAEPFFDYAKEQNITTTIQHTYATRADILAYVLRSVISADTNQAYSVSASNDYTTATKKL